MPRRPPLNGRARLGRHSVPSSPQSTTPAVTEAREHPLQLNGCRRGWLQIAERRLTLSCSKSTALARQKLPAETPSLERSQPTQLRKKHDRHRSATVSPYTPVLHAHTHTHDTNSIANDSNHLEPHLKTKTVAWSIVAIHSKSYRFPPFIPPPPLPLQVCGAADSSA